MNDPWIHSNLFGAVLGSLFGCLAGLWGSLAEKFSAQGKFRMLILGWGWSLFGCSLLALAASVVAWFYGQPYGVWYPLVLVGALGSIIFPVRLLPIRQRYLDHESRRMQAEDLL